MLRASPIKLYLLYLLVKGWGLDRIEAHCLQLGLDYLHLDYLRRVQTEAGFPQVFRPNDINHLPSRKWLEENGLGELFPGPQPPVFQAAFQLIQRPRAKEVLETMALAKAYPETIAQSLLRIRIRTTPEVVVMALKLFWNMEVVDSQEVRVLLHLRTTAHQEPPLEDTVNAQGNPRAARSPLPGFAAAVKKASYADPRLMVASIPGSPLAVLLAQSALGMPLSKLDLAKVYDMLIVLLTHKVIENATSTAADATLRTQTALTSVKLAQDIQSKFVAPDQNTHDLLKAAMIRYEKSGITGTDALTQLTQGKFSINPYGKKDDQSREALRSKEPGQGGGSDHLPAGAARTAASVVPGQDGDEG